MLQKISLMSVLIVMIAILPSCGSVGGPSETMEFTLEPSGGYNGKPVGNCDQKNANEECRLLGWDRAVDWDCGTVHVTGGFFGSFDQDVMYSVTCER